MPTKPDISRHKELSVRQANAVDLLLAGKTDGEVAKAVRVTRQTVNEWRNGNTEFMAELNARRVGLSEPQAVARPTRTLVFIRLLRHEPLCFDKNHSGFSAFPPVPRRPVPVRRMEFDRVSGQGVAANEFIETYGEHYEVRHVPGARQPSLVLRKLTGGTESTKS